MKTPKELWEEKAKTFPVYDEDDAEDIKFIEKVIGAACDRGPDIKGKYIIDIGCGTGRHTLSLARKAAGVHGVDISEDMVRVLKNTRDKYGFKNVTAETLDWKEACIEKTGWLKKFDIAWAAMTGAINTAEDVARMNMCAREWAVCIAWGRKRENIVLQETFAAHGAELKLPPGLGEVKTALDELAIDHRIDYIENSWSFEGTREEAAADLIWHLKMSRIEPDEKKVYAIVDQNKKNGIYGHSTTMEMAVIRWKIN